MTPDGGTPRRTIGQAVTGEVEPLGMTVDTKTAAKMLGVGYEALLDSLAAGAPPLAPIKVGRIYRWPTRPLLQLLGVDGGQGNG